MVVRACVAVLMLGLLAGSPGAVPVQGPGPRVIDITAERFEFWPTEVIVAEGEQVELRLRSEDTMHGFRIVGAGTNVLIPKRGNGYAVLMFTGSQTGRYTFECSRMCGAGHNFMRGALVVRPQSAAR
jgi:cytochrome c oxidase subunit II